MATVPTDFLQDSVHSLRLCLISDHSGNLDEGMKNISRHIHRYLQKNNDVMSLPPKSILNINTIKKIYNFAPNIVIYSHGPTFRSLVVLCFIKMILFYKGTKIAIWASKPFLNGIGVLLLSLLSPELVIVQSIYFENIVKKLKVNYHFLSNGVNVNKFKPLMNDNQRDELRNKYKVPIDKFVILHVGHLKHNRGFEVFKILNKEKYFILIVSSTFMEEELGVRKLFSSNNIHIIRYYLPKIEELYQLSDLYLFTPKNKVPKSKTDIGAIDLPLSIYEAMACNLPIVTTRFGKIPDLFRETEYFRYYDSSEELRQIVYEMECLNNEKNINYLIVQEYSWDNILGKFEKFLWEILNLKLF